MADKWTPVKEAIVTMLLGISGIKNVLTYSPNSIQISPIALVQRLVADFPTGSSVGPDVYTVRIRLLSFDIDEQQAEVDLENLFPIMRDTFDRTTLNGAANVARLATVSFDPDVKVEYANTLCIYADYTLIVTAKR